MMDPMMAAEDPEDPHRESPVMQTVMEKLVVEEAGHEAPTSQDAASSPRPHRNWPHSPTSTRAGRRRRPRSGPPDHRDAIDVPRRLATERLPYQVGPEHPLPDRHHHGEVSVEDAPPRDILRGSP